MTFDLQRVLESKRAFRRKIAARPLVEKLRMLDDLRERALLIRRATAAALKSGMVSEAPTDYGIEGRTIVAADTDENRRKQKRD